MDAKLKRKWVEALRSGHYEQGRLSLFAEGKWCCMGVLGHLAGITPNEMEWHGWSPVAHLVTPEMNTQINNCIAMNDKGRSFAEIADYIEANL